LSANRKKEGSGVMELDERKLKILQAIIRTYLDTGEPVGSRTISKYTDLNLSSATIRNEMSDLEELGYILQPHTSAGRIPSDKGYRLYVDTMLDARESEVQSLKEELEEKAGKIDEVLQKVAKYLAANTNYATMVSGPRYQTKKVKFIQITLVDEEHLLAVIVLDNNAVKNQMIRVEEPVSQEMVVKLNFILNTTLNGLDVLEINLAVIQGLKEQLGEHTQVVDSVIEVIGRTLVEEDDLEVYTSGATNILKYPELSDKTRAAEILGAFEEKKILHNWLGLPDRSHAGESHDIQVYIGDETQMDTMKDCSMVTATYQIQEGVYGKIGIVGPKRMDYDKVVGTLNSLMGQLDDIFKEKKRD
jgi:heat shock gene repressor HrcA